MGARRTSQPSPSLVAWANLPPSTPSTSRGAARGARAGALREGIRNSEIKCISLGNAPHSADQIKRIKVQGGESCLEPRGEKQVQREEKQKRRKEEQRGRAEQQLYSQAFFSELFPVLEVTTTRKKEKEKKVCLTIQVRDSCSPLAPGSRSAPRGAFSRRPGPKQPAHARWPRSSSP